MRPFACAALATAVSAVCALAFTHTAAATGVPPPHTKAWFDTEVLPHLTRNNSRHINTWVALGCTTGEPPSDNDDGVYCADPNATAIITHIRVKTQGFSGSLPTQLGLMTHLVELTVRNNFLRGSIPTELGRLAMLNTLILQGNRLVGTVPTELASLPLKRLFLHFNNLSGALPSLTNVSQTCLLVADDHLSTNTGREKNMFDCPLPVDLSPACERGGANATLRCFNVSVSESVGSYVWFYRHVLPHLMASDTGLPPAEMSCYPAMVPYTSTAQCERADGEAPGEARYVRVVSLPYRGLSGTLPSLLGQMTSLLYLGLPGNDLRGSLPTELALLTVITTIDVRFNRLTGRVPPLRAAFLCAFVGDADDNNTFDCVPHGELPCLLRNSPLRCATAATTTTAISATADATPSSGDATQTGDENSLSATVAGAAAAGALLLVAVCAGALLAAAAYAWRRRRRAQVGSDGGSDGAAADGAQYASVGAMLQQPPAHSYDDMMMSAATTGGYERPPSELDSSANYDQPSTPLGAGGATSTEYDAPSMRLADNGSDGGTGTVVEYDAPSTRLADDDAGDSLDRAMKLSLD